VWCVQRRKLTHRCTTATRHHSSRNRLGVSSCRGFAPLRIRRGRLVLTRQLHRPTHTICVMHDMQDPCLGQAHGRGQRRAQAQHRPWPELAARFGGGRCPLPAGASSSRPGMWGSKNLRPSCRTTTCGGVAPCCTRAGTLPGCPQHPPSWHAPCRRPPVPGWCQLGGCCGCPKCPGHNKEGQQHHLWGSSEACGPLGSGARGTGSPAGEWKWRCRSAAPAPLLGHAFRPKHPVGVEQRRDRRGQATMPMMHQLQQQQQQQRQCCVPGVAHPGISSVNARRTAWQTRHHGSPTHPPTPQRPHHTQRRREHAGCSGGVDGAPSRINSTSRANVGWRLRPRSRHRKTRRQRQQPVSQSQVPPPLPSTLPITQWCLLMTSEVPWPHSVRAKSSLTAPCRVGDTAGGGPFCPPFLASPPYGRSMFLRSLSARPMRHRVGQTTRVKTRRVVSRRLQCWSSGSRRSKMLRAPQTSQHQQLLLLLQT